MVFCFLASFQITVVEIALVPLALAPLIRSTMTYRLWPGLLVQPLMVLTVAWCLWLVWSAWRSPTPGPGWRLAGELRWAWLIVAIWPVIEFRTALIAAWALGFAAGHSTQLVHALTASGLIDGPTWGRQPDRISGWWEPVGGATALCAAFGLHLGAVSMGQGRWRLLAAGAASITLLGILATGTRGAWVAAGLTLTIAGAVYLPRAWRSKSRGQARPARTLGVIALIVLLSGTAAWALAGRQIQDRVTQARAELHAAISEGDYDSFTGARLLMWRQAWRALQANPLQGVGLGAYQQWARHDLRQTDPAAPLERIHTHAHGMVPHAAAETGSIGMVLLVALLGTALLGSMSGRAGGSCHPSGYSRAVPLALVGIVLASIFESVPFVSRASVHFWLLLALCPAWRPPPRSTRSLLKRDRAP